MWADRAGPASCGNGTAGHTGSHTACRPPPSPGCPGLCFHPRLPFQKELEAAWGVQVCDRFTVVLHIFRCNARTKEARLQVALAELPLLR